MKTCALCNKEVVVDRYFSRKSECPHCSGDLHICLNCRFYSATSHNKCIETKAEFQRSRDKANYCDYFEFRESASTSSGQSDAEEARRKLDELFG